MSGARCPIYAGAVRVPDAAELAAWAEKARAGDRFVYCEASALVQGDTARLAAELEQAGLVVLAQTRRAGGGFEFAATRTRLRAATAIKAQPAGQDPESEVILRLLRQAARLKLPCPSLKDLSRKLEGVGIELTVGQVRHRFDRLIDDGLIRSTVYSDNGANVRVVTIAATGESTRVPPQWAALQRSAAHG